MTQLHIQPLKKAFAALESAYIENPTELERDGLIQRFEFSLEMTWKTAKKILQENGIEVDVPKNVFRELAQLGWIESAENWMIFVNARNKASQIYNEKVAAEVFATLPRFIQEAKLLISVLEDKCQ